MFQHPGIKIVLLLSICGEIPVKIQAQYYANHVKVSSRLDLSGQLKKLCGGNDDSDSDDEVSCDCLSKLAISSTVQVGKYQNGLQYDESNQNDDSYSSLHQTDKDLGVYGFGRINLENVKCVDDNQVKEAKSRYTHWFHPYGPYVIATVPNGIIEYDYTAEEFIPMAITDITTENAPQIKYIKLEKDEEEIENFEGENFGTMCGEALEEGSKMKAYWSIIDQVVVRNDNNCNFPNGTFFPAKENIPLKLTLDEPLECGDYTLSWGMTINNDMVKFHGKIYWYLEQGGSCL